ncbi:MAG: hypothetical protein P8X74_03825 [Reinekea sp.]
MQTQIKLIRDFADRQVEIANNLKEMAGESVTEKDRERLYLEACDLLATAAKLRESVINLCHIQHVNEEIEDEKGN